MSNPPPADRQPAAGAEPRNTVYGGYLKLGEGILNALTTQAPAHTH